MGGRIQLHFFTQGIDVGAALVVFSGKGDEIAVPASGVAKGDVDVEA